MRPTTSCTALAVLCLFFLGTTRAGTSQNPPPTAASTAVPSILDQLDRYARGESAPSGASDLATTTRDLRRSAPVWIAAAAGQQQLHRRLIVATYVLELLQGVDTPATWAGNQSAPALLEWASEILRQGAPVPAERTWFSAGIALMQRRSPPDVVLAHAARAEGRFPGDARWEMARLVAEERRSWPERRDNSEILVASRGADTRLVARYQEAVANSAANAEAHLRWGYYEFQVGRTDSALAHFDHVGAPTDPVLRYWLGLLRGRALVRANRVVEAMASYQSALRAFPHAHAASVGLAALFTTQHRPSDAAALVAEAMAADPPLDPWVFWNSPEVRFWQSGMLALRQEVTR